VNKCRESQYTTMEDGIPPTEIKPSPAAQLEPQADPENNTNDASVAPPGASPAPTPAPAPAQTQPASRTPIPPPIQREQREKKDSLKKRESAAPSTSNAPTSNVSTTLGKRKAHQVHAYPSPQRFNIPPPKAQDFEAPKDDMMAEHEPNQFWVPGEERQLYKPIDLAENKRGYRYQRAIADPVFTHKQYYRSTSPAPHGARLSFEDADRWMHFTTNALTTSNEKGWRMVRANVCAREGTLYYEVKVRRGVPPGGPDPAADGPQPFVRFGWARREAPLDAPVGFDGYSYGITDMRFETMHRSRPGKFFHPKKGKNKPKTMGVGPTPVTLAPEDQHVKEGDVIGMEIQLPSLSLQQKIVTGVYNPAVDIADGFTESNAPPVPGPDEQVPDIIRDRIPVAYKGNSYFEILDHVSTRPMEVYSDRTTNLTTLATQPGASAGAGKDTIRQVPNPNHEQAPLRTLPHSAIRVYKNGKPIGTAFENLLAFLPPASQPSKQHGAREGGFDDAMTGYFPAVSCFFGGTAEINFGDGKDGFWAPPAHLRNTKTSVPVTQHHDSTQDVEMRDAPNNDEERGRQGWRPGKECRPIGERYKEQVAEDIVYDIIDEVDFFVQDGGYEGKAGQGAHETEGNARAGSRLRED
jgi:COMPASS component BRE2